MSFDKNYPYDRSKLGLSKGDPKRDHWVAGNVKRFDGYRFSAKVYDVGSRSGIDGGRVSKLRVERDGKTVIDYSRGWPNGRDPKAMTGEQKAVLKEIVSAFPEPRQLDLTFMQAKAKLDDLKKQGASLARRSDQRDGTKEREAAGQAKSSTKTNAADAPMRFFSESEQGTNNPTADRAASARSRRADSLRRLSRGNESDRSRGR